MPEFLLEVGCEELPAFSIQGAASALRDSICAKLDEASLSYGEATEFSTPRRLIVIIKDVQSIQEDRQVKKRGPTLSVAYAEDGSPTQALIGFARSNGVAPEEVIQEDGNVWAESIEKGRSASEVLAESIPEIVLGLSFSKTMRWGDRRTRFARPIRWIVALFGGEVVPFEIAGVESGNQSFAHRSMAPGSFEVSDGASLISGLRERFVEPDPAKREKTILEQVQGLVGESADIGERLLAENVDLTEWPQTTLGAIPEEYIELPEAVLVTAMAKHERFFPVRSVSGNLESRFLSVRNGGQEEIVRRGNEWVLKARFNDARFYFLEDSKTTLEEFREQTRRIQFHEGLGDVYQRSERLAALAKSIAEAWGLDVRQAGAAEQAGLLCKADLATGLVSELPSLQGVIGGEYARRDGLSEDVCLAIANQYDPVALLEKRPRGFEVGLALALADNLDKLVGYLGKGLVPTGSQDPFGLRRAVSNLVQICWGLPLAKDGLRDFFDQSVELYNFQNDDDQHVPMSLTHFAEMLEQRYEAMEAWGYDVQDALVEVSGPDLLNPRRIRLCASALTALKDDQSAVQAATRPVNIAKAARKKGLYAFPAELAELRGLEVEHDVERELVVELEKLTSNLDRAFASEDSKSLAEAISQARPFIDRYFETVMVMAEQESLRDARLKLMASLEQQILRVGDVTKLVQA